jgi:hypothetical protein
VTANSPEPDHRTEDRGDRPFHRHWLAAARVLAGGADRDIEQVRGEIRDFRQATTSSFNAMREDLTDLRTHVDTGFATVERGLTEMRGKFDAAAAGQQQIAELLSTLIAQGEQNG